MPSISLINELIVSGDTFEVTIADDVTSGVLTMVSAVNNGSETAVVVLYLNDIQVARNSALAVGDGWNEPLRVGVVAGDVLGVFVNESGINANVTGVLSAS